MNATEAFVPGPRVKIAGAADGPLAGLSFAVKDLIDVAGVVTGGGSPDWPAFGTTPARHAAVVQTLLDAGASVIGKTITDEVSLGILGENAHDGTPLNPAAPDRVPGGSSSGSASAVASGTCDFALGTDSGGSVRVPASFCGLYGIRPTHGRIDFSGITVQSPSADTCGWFARDARTFSRVAEVLFGAALPDRLPTTLLVATDAFGFADEAVAAALQGLVDRLTGLIGGRRDVTMAPPGLSVWQRAQRVLQSSESWKTFEPWLDRHDPRLAWSVARNLVQGSMLTDAERSAATLMRIEARARLRELLPAGTILCMPTTPFPAPLKGLPLHELGPLRERISCLTSHGGLTGVPQLSIPGATVDGAPVGLSIVGGRGADLDLVRVAVALEGLTMDTTLNRPEIVAEVTALFERYEQALIDKDVDVLDATFWNSPHTIRYALRDNGYGFDAIHASRVGAARVPGGSKETRIRLEILTVGSDLATVNLEFKARGRAGIGRQSQTWVRFAEGWKVIAAHVSIMPDGGW